MWFSAFCSRFFFLFLFLGGIQTNIHICAKIYNIIYIYSFFCFVLSSLVCKKSAILKEKKTETPAYLSLINVTVLTGKMNC